MTSYEDDAPRLSEIGRMIGGVDRKLDDFRQEVRAALQDKVSKEVYQAERSAQNDRILVLENKFRSITNQVWGMLGTIMIAVIIAYLGLK